LTRKRFFLILLMLLWMGLMFWFSAQSGTDSAAMSGKLLRWVFAHIPHWDSLTDAQQRLRIKAFHNAFRKLAHFFEYAVLGIFASLVMRQFSAKNDDNQIRQRVRCLLIPACFALLCGAVDELHQSFVPGRNPFPFDVVIDFAGACLGILILKLILDRRPPQNT